jgi:hypothetical protein
MALVGGGRGSITKTRTAEVSVMPDCLRRVDEGAEIVEGAAFRGWRFA